MASLLLPLLGAGAVLASGPKLADARQSLTACGVERWPVKTGTDADVHAVNLNRVSSTNIGHLDSLGKPGYLPRSRRVRPTETTVFGVLARLIRFKREPDSDYHLVIRGPSGAHMIAEIPSPSCVGPSSPFYSRITNARAAFNRRYRVEGFWHRVNVKITLTGVGFFDDIHGQSGVAPNGIELHPVLSVKFRTRPKPPAPPRPPSKPGAFSLRVWVSPSSMPYNAYPTLYAKTVAGASCTASVTYFSGRPPRSFDGSARVAGGSGVVSWSWHEETRSAGGTASATCMYRGQSKTASTTFRVV